jgi:hypothetical protein
MRHASKIAVRKIERDMGELGIDDRITFKCIFQKLELDRFHLAKEMDGW